MPTSPRYTQDPSLADTNSQEVVDDHPYHKQRTSHTGVVNMTKVFGIMFLLILGTAAITLLLGYLFDLWLETNYSAASTGILVIMIVACVLQLILCISLMFTRNRSRSRGATRSLTISILYAVVMGVMMSSFTLYIDWEVLGITFAITAVVFGLMTLIAYGTKGRFSGAAMVGMGLAMAAMIIMMFGLLFGLIWPDFFDTMYMIIMGVMVIAMMLITLYDVARIRRIVNEDISNDQAYYCAFRLYTDFICIFIYLLYFLVRIFGRMRR
ncbi:MAG: Bax inhibitor-1 family protein [Coprobacillus sp.]|nr:Bax inhibitor-1 family protein [Coprobacillus sp.]